MVLIQKEIKKVYLGNTLVWGSPIETPWIYHNSGLWLISLSSNGSDWLTIADKNLGATIVYNTWDTLSGANCWWLFQPWNNYMFPFTWAATTSSNKVNAQNYWPWNYYSGSTFRTAISSPYGWESSNNRNLRWWVTWTVEAKQWPCPSWFHVPTSWEWWNLRTAMSSLGFSSWNQYKAKLFIPIGGNLAYNSGENYNQNNAGEYCCSNFLSDNNYAYFFLTYPSSVNVLYDYSSYWGFVRPFYNEWVQPDTSWTKL